MSEQNSIDKLAPYILNWTELIVSLAKGRFKHFIGRPSKTLLLERDKEIKSETPIAKDGGYSANAGDDEQEVIDAKYAQKLRLREPEGYTEEVEQDHEAAVWSSIYRRHVFIPEDADIFGEVIPVHEVIGADPDNPVHEVIHHIRKPNKDDLKKMKNALKGGRYVPDKRGRQKFVAPSYLTKAVAFYTLYLHSQEGSAIEKVITPAAEGIEEKTELIYFSKENREQFIEETDILIQRKVVEVLVKELKDNLLD